MRIGIVTFHNAKNYGAILQAYALSKFINTEFKNADAEVIDYRCKYLEDFYNPELAYGDTIKGKIKRLLARNVLSKRNAVFDDFMYKNIPLSETYDASSINQVQDYDVYIAGSDMIWHWHTTNEGEFFDNNYFLNFVDVSNKKNSYAASFGAEKISDKYRNYYGEMLEDFNHISVREKSGMKLIEEYTGKDSVCHIDPTLLFTMKEWKAIEKKPNQTGYVLLYEVGGISDRMLDAARRIAESHNKKVVILLSEYNPIRKKGVFGYSPEEFLGWFDNADYVVTNSFHGTVFSILYHKQFLVEVNSLEKNNRSSELMERLELDTRTIEGNTDVDSSIDWTMVDEKLDDLRRAARNYLQKTVCED